MTTTPHAQTSPTLQSEGIAAPEAPLSLKQPRLEYLDAVRGLAAMAVIGNHYFQAYIVPRGQWLWTNTPLHIVWDGFAAVSMFFVLSGLVLSMRHFRTSQTPDLSRFSLAGYWVSRICRLWIPYLTVLLLSAVIYWRLGKSNHLTSPRATPWLLDWWPGGIGMKELVRESFLFRLKSPQYFALVPVAWTLAVELVLSMAIPVAVITASRGTGWLIAISLVLSLGLGLPYFFHFALGTAIAKHFADLGRIFEGSVTAWWIALVAGLGLYACRYSLWAVGLPETRQFVASAVWYVTAVGSALILACVISSPRLRQVLSGRVLRHLGRISYSVYLTHLAIIICLVPRFLHLLNRHSIPCPWLLGLLATVVATMCVADLLYRLAEVPSMAMGRRLAARIAAITIPKNTPIAAVPPLS